MYFQVSVSGSRSNYKGSGSGTWRGSVTKNFDANLFPEPRQCCWSKTFAGNLSPKISLSNQKIELHWFFYLFRETNCYKIRRFSKDYPIKPENGITLVFLFVSWNELLLYWGIWSVKIKFQLTTGTENMHRTVKFLTGYSYKYVLQFEDNTYYLRAELSLQIESRTWVSCHIAQRREEVGIDGAQSRVVSARQKVLFLIIVRSIIS